jgi:hypothetical protein
LEAHEVGRWRRRNKTLAYCRELLSLDKHGRGPALTDHEIDPELYSVELEKASGKAPEDWNIECCMCECSLDFVNLPKGSEAQRIWREVGIHELPGTNSPKASPMAMA